MDEVGPIKDNDVVSFVKGPRRSQTIKMHRWKEGAVKAESDYF